MGALDGLMNPAGVGQGIAQAFQAGAERRADMETRGALSAFAVDPNDPQAFATLAKYRPELAMQVRQQREERAREAAKRDVYQRYGAGDPGAAMELWGVDPEMAAKLSDGQKKKVGEGFEFVANAAYQIQTLPEDQRAAAWDSYIGQGVEMGFDGLAKYQGKYTPDLLNSVVARAGQGQKFQEFQQPRYVSVGEGGLQGTQFGRLVGATMTSESNPSLSAPEFNPLVEGNINLHDRPNVKNADGSISTVRTISIGTDSGEVVIPTVSEDGRIMSDEEAVSQYEVTGRHLGIFRTPSEATAFAESLHDDQAKEYLPSGARPQVGAVEDGYRFNGGDPGSPGSWSKVEGGAGSGPSTFPTG